MRSLTIWVLMWRWFIVWLLIVFNPTYSYDMLYSLCQCAIRIDESEISSVCTYISTYICMNVCMYVRTYEYVYMYVCMYVCVHTYVRMYAYVRTYVCVNVCVCTYIRTYVHLYACVPEKEILVVIKCRLTFERNRARQKFGEFTST